MTALVRHRLLLIDPDLPFIAQLSSFLDARYDIVHECEGRLVLEHLERFCPDLVIAEIDLPQIDGMSFISHLHRHRDYANVPVILASYRDTKEDMLRGYQAGAVIYLSKRVGAERIARNIDVYIEQNHLPIRPKLGGGYIPKEYAPPKTDNPSISGSRFRAVSIPTKEKPAVNDDNHPGSMTPTVISAEPRLIAINPNLVYAGRPRVLIAAMAMERTIAFETQLASFCDCILAENGMAAVDKACRYVPDILVLDVRLPNLAGFEVCRVLRSQQQFRNTPIVGIARAGDPMIGEYPLRFGMTSVLTEPLTDESIPDEVRRLRDAFLRPHAYPQSFEEVHKEEDKIRAKVERIVAQDQQISRQREIKQFYEKVKKDERGVRQ
jgi:CheY-like chemotaxis protein